MAATNYTPIQLYHSTTASASPTAGNLVNGELAINILDGKLYYKDNGGVVQVIATKGTGTIGGSTTQVQYNLSGALAGSSNFTFNGTTATINTLNLTNALGAAYGGTAQSTYAQGDLLYASAANTLAKLPIGINTYILTSNGSIPGWSIPSSVVIGTATNLAGGAAGSVPYQSGAGTTTFLSIGTANQVVTSTGSAPQWSSALTLTGLSNSGLTTLDKTVTVGNTSFNGAAVFAPATPAKVYLGTGTVTDVTSAIAATNAAGAIVALGVTPIAATNANVTYTNASTLYIAGAPSAGTNITITNPYALYVAAGDAYFGGTVTAGTVNLTTLDLTNLEVTNIKAKDGTASMTLADTTGIITLSATAGTANGVAYLNGSRALTTGSALTFDGTKLGVASGNIDVVSASFVGSPLIAARFNASNFRMGIGIGNSNGFPFLGANVNNAANDNGTFDINGYASRIRLDNGVFQVQTSSASGTAGNAITWTTPLYLEADGDLGIGTTSPGTKLDVVGAGAVTSGTMYSTIITRQDTTTKRGIFLGYDSSGQIGVIGTDSAGAAASIAFWTYNGSAWGERMRLDSSGNLGLGVTPSAWASTHKAYQLPGGGGLYNNGADGYLNLANNFYYDGADWRRVTAAPASTYLQSSSGHLWGYVGTGTANSVCGFPSAQMALDTSGNLGLGVTPSVWSQGKAFEISAVGEGLWGNGLGDIWMMNGAYFNSGWKYSGATKATAYRQGAGTTDGSHSWHTAPSGTANSASVTSGASYTVVALGSSTLAQWQAFFNDSSNNPLTVTPTLGQVLTGNATGTLLGGGLVTQNISFTQAMTLDASGNFYVGTTSQVGGSNITFNQPNNADLKIAASVSTATRAVYQVFVNSAVTTVGTENSTGGSLASGTAAYATVLANNGAYPICFATNNTERARITSGGDLLVGGIASTGANEKFLSTTSTTTAITAQNTNASNTSDVILARASRNTTNSTFRAITYYNDGAGEYRFIVQDSGNVENKNNSYGAISDIKLKENITDATPKLEKLQQVRVVNYNLIGETQKQIGVIAQELEQIFPGMVDEAPDRDAEGNDLGTTTKSVKYSVFVPMLIKAIQEQQTIIQSLTARIAALESKGA